MGPFRLQPTGSLRHVRCREYTLGYHLVRPSIRVTREYLVVNKDPIVIIIGVKCHFLLTVVTYVITLVLTQCKYSFSSPVYSQLEVKMCLRFRMIIIIIGTI